MQLPAEIEIPVLGKHRRKRMWGISSEVWASSLASGGIASSLARRIDFFTPADRQRYSFEKVVLYLVSSDERARRTRLGTERVGRRQITGGYHQL